MDIDILYSGYSFHTDFFSINDDKETSIYILRLQTEGSCECKINGRLYHLKKGDLMLLKPKDSYQLAVPSFSDNYSENNTIVSGDFHLLCTGSWIESWWNSTIKDNVVQVNLDEFTMNIWSQVINENRRSLISKKFDILEHLSKTLCLYIERAINETTRTQNIPYVVAKMMRYIEEHATTVFKVDDVASHVGLSFSRASTIFKKHTNKTMIEYSIEIRLSIAKKKLIYSNLSIEQIALDCGFGSYSYFHKLFKNKKGIAPRAYRLKAQQPKSF